MPDTKYDTWLCTGKGSRAFGHSGTIGLLRVAQKRYLEARFQEGSLVLWTLKELLRAKGC